MFLFPSSLAAAAALLKHLEHAEGIFYAPKSLKVEFQASMDSALLDGGTAKHVNLFPTPTPGTTRARPTSLFGLLNHCSTPGGVRYLRAGLFQPPVNQHVIEARHEA
jgi:DNA mismatch repair protein MSH4